MCFIVVLFLGCSLYLLLGRTYTIPIAFGLYLKGPSSSFGLATPYSIWEHQNFPLNKVLSRRRSTKDKNFCTLLLFIYIYLFCLFRKQQIIFRRSHAQKIKMESLFGQKEKVKKFLALSMCNTYVLPSRHQLHDQIQPMLGTCALYIYNNSTVGGWNI